MLTRITLTAIALIVCVALAAWQVSGAGAEEPPGPPALTSPFAEGQPWLITCGYALPEDDEEAPVCGHNDSQWGRYALDFQLLGGPNAATGQRVLAAADGVVSASGWEDGFGWHVVIDHVAGYQTVYAHMLAEPLLDAGDDVDRGDVLGLTGCTGRCSGAHIHFALWHNGVSVPPEPICGLRDFRPGQVLVGCTTTELSYADLLALGADRDPLRPAVSDFDGDGAEDAALIVARLNGELRIDVLSESSDGPVVARYGVETPGDGGALGGQAFAADFDGDGRADIATLEYSVEDCDAQLRVFLAANDRFAETGPDGWWEDDDTCAAGVQHAVAGDYNGDGRADIALMVTSDDAVDIRVLLSNGVRLLVSPEPWWHGTAERTGAVFQLLPGDFDDDGRTDLAAFGPATFGCESQVLVYRSTGAAFRPRGPEPSWHDRAFCAHNVALSASGDFDGDGAVDDIALLTEDSTFLRRIDVLVGDGALFERKLLPWWYELVLYPPTQVNALLPADFDGDGATDLAAVVDNGECGATVALLRSRGDGFNTVDEWPRAGHCKAAVLAALP